MITILGLPIKILNSDINILTSASQKDPHST